MIGLRHIDLLGSVPLVATLLVFVTAMEQGTRICRSTCGNYTVNYPFGLDIGCGLPQFQMTCVEHDPKPLKLILSSKRFNVQSIDYYSRQIVLEDPFMSDCGNLKSDSAGFQLELFGTGFALSGDTVLLLNCLGFSEELNFLNSQYDCHNPTCLTFLTNCHLDDILTSCCRVTDPGNTIDLYPLQCMSYTSIYDPKNPIFDPFTWSFGIELEWSVPSESGSSCERCETSDGVCGYTIDDSHSPFTCICDYGNSTTQCEDCIDGSCEARRSPAMTVGLSVGATLIMFCIVSAIVVSAKQKSKSMPETFSNNSFLLHNPSTELAQVLATMTGPLPMKLFSYKELEDATASFSEKRLLGDGGYGMVYKAKFCDGRILAVKRLNYQNHRRLEQFYNEVRILAQVRHPNLVQLIGFCLEGRDLLLVYEYVCNGTLEEHIHAPPGLLWETRLQIAIDVAQALSYLHFSVNPPILHRDVKSSNILLDEKFHAKVADFGLSRLVPMSTTHVSTAPQGTPGYVDPEYHHCYRLTDKSDVYSFGVVLMELLSAKRVIDLNRRGNEVNLSSFAIGKIQNGALHELLDPNLTAQCQDANVHEMVKNVAELAFKCVASLRNDRPTTKDVRIELQRIQMTGHCKSISTV